MGTPITLPAPIDPVPDLHSAPRSAVALTTDLRVSAIGLHDAADRCDAHGGRAWEGEAETAHRGARLRFRGRLDVASVALDRAVRAAARFEERLGELARARGSLDAERADVNEELAILRVELDAALDEVETQRLRAERLVERAALLRREIARWVRRAEDAEADLIVALRSVDTPAEGRRAASDPDRVDPGEVADLGSRLRSLAATPSAAAAWWRTLTRAQREALIAEHPRRVGATDGLPAQVRDRANRASAAHDLVTLARRERVAPLDPGEARTLANVRTILGALDGLRHTVDPVTGLPLAHLMSYRPGAFDGDGGVAVSIGDPDTAEHVAVTVPGFTTEASSLPGHLDELAALHEQSNDQQRGSVAVVYWADYDAPSGDPRDPGGLEDLLGVTSTDEAAAGGERLADHLDGLAAADTGEEAHVTAIGHSYGSTTLGHALLDGADADDAVLLGSPGQPTATAGDLTDADVWVGSMDHDPVTLLGEGDRGGLGVLGHDPAGERFGARRFETGDGSPLLSDLIDNHSAYDEGVSHDNVVAIVTGQEEAVTGHPGRGEDTGEYLTLTELLWHAGRLEGADWLLDRLTP